jgi:RNA polymerase sigma-70 factor, ECF subfamily
MSSSTPPEAARSPALEPHRRLLWSLLYRMTGSAADAEDLVQDTFARALERPPARSDEPLRPWLVQVALNLGRDQLRRRRRSPYVGPWLPTPVEDVIAEVAAVAESSAPSAEARYSQVESARYAFLVALEALNPVGRAVLLLRDVFDYSVHETALALGLSEANVKTSHHRARRAMAAYDTDRVPVSPPDAPPASLMALQGFLAALSQQDTQAAEAYLRDDVRALSDGGGVHLAASRPVVGVRRVRILFEQLIRKQGDGFDGIELRRINGEAALLVRQRIRLKRQAPLLVMRCDVDPEGKIYAFHSILAPAKLTHIAR